MKESFRVLSTQRTSSFMNQLPAVFSRICCFIYPENILFHEPLEVHGKIILAVNINTIAI